MVICARTERSATRIVSTLRSTRAELIMRGYETTTAFTSLPDPSTVKHAFDSYEWADSCSSRTADTSLHRDAHRRPDECRVSDADIDIARAAPDLVPGLTVETKARMGKVFSLLRTAARNGQAHRIR
jgi:hypothetical protein